MRKYTAPTIFFHWAVAALVIYNILLSPELEDVPPETAADTMALHMGVGFTILVLMIARLYWRLTHPAPALPEAMPPWQARVARGTHWALYAAVFAMVTLGLVAAAFAPYASAAFGLIPLDWFSPGNKDVYELMAGAHGVIAWAIIALFALHVGAALYHSIFKRDGVLRSMLPW